jgi:hypothetical protein
MMTLIDAAIAERRLHPRTQIQMPIQAIRLDPDGADLLEQLEMVDISRGGMGAISSRAFYPGQRLVMKLPGLGMSVRSICGVIRRCAKVEERHHLGIQFEQPLASLCADPYDMNPAAVATMAA